MAIIHDVKFRDNRTIYFFRGASSEMRTPLDQTPDEFAEWVHRSLVEIASILSSRPHEVASLKASFQESVREVQAVLETVEPPDEEPGSGQTGHGGDAPRLGIDKRFAIALSFPGERRDFVEQVASHLAERVGQERVLYDKYHEAEFAQPDLDVYLPNLYRTESELIVIFLCADYAKKRWCKLEWRSVRQLISTSESQRIMFVSFDEIGAVPELGISSGDGYVSVGSRSSNEIGTLIFRRLERNRQKEKLDIRDAPRVTSLPVPQGPTNANMQPMERDRAKAHLPEQGKSTLPTDLISAAVAVKDYSVSRATLRRAVAERRLRDYRPEGHLGNASLRLSRAEVANIWPKRGQ